MLPGLGRYKGVNVPAVLATMAVVGYMATAGLPWWAVVAVVVLTAGLAGRNGMRKTVQSQPVKSSIARTSVEKPWAEKSSPEKSWTEKSSADKSWADKYSTVVPVAVNVRVTCPDEYTQMVCSGPEPVLRNR